MEPTNGSDESGGLASARARSSLIYCGFCGALNPATNHFCAACGSVLIDAFHASEGLRVYERPDSASRLVEIVPAGGELDFVPDPDAPEDFVRIRLAQGRLGYIRLQEVEAAANAPPAPVAIRTPDINTNARGCVSTTGALASLALFVIVTTVGLYLLSRSDSADTGILALFFCVAVAPLMILTIALYLMARGREDRLAAEDAEALTRQPPTEPA